jgi:hypothetical protein
MVNTKIEQKIANRLQLILKYTTKIAKKNSLEIELPRAEVDYFWLEQDEKGNGQGRRGQTNVPLLYKADDLVDQVTSIDQTLTHKITKFGVYVKSIISNISFPAFIESSIGKEPLSIAKLIISQYLQEVGTLKIRKSVIKKITKEFVDDICSESYSAIFVILVQNFKAPRSFRLSSNIKFRPICTNDYIKYSVVEPGAVPSHKEPWVGSNDWICIVEDTGPKSTTTAMGSHREYLDKIAGALTLTNNGRANFYLLQSSYKSRFFNIMNGRGGDFVHSSGIGSTIDLDNRGVTKYKNSYKLVNTIVNDSKYESLRLPFRRLRLSSTRGNDNDKFVDYIVGLERLLSPDSPNLEITFRFRLRGASLLSKSFGSERARLFLMSNLYNIRSNIVHGKESLGEVQEFLGKSEQIFIDIFWNYAKLLSKYNSDSILIKKLDEALVKGGYNFVRSSTL